MFKQPSCKMLPWPRRATLGVLPLALPVQLAAPSRLGGVADGPPGRRAAPDRERAARPAYAAERGGPRAVNPTPVDSQMLTVQLSCAPPVCPGDANCDNAVSWRDIDFFVAGMNDNRSAWRARFLPGEPTCAFSNLDTNSDGHVTWRDIDTFVALMNTTCQLQREPQRPIMVARRLASNALTRQRLTEDVPLRAGLPPKQLSGNRKTGEPVWHEMNRLGHAIGVSPGVPSRSASSGTAFA